MDEEKKQELAESKPAWGFQEEIQVPRPDTDWNDLLKAYNEVVDDQARIYLSVTELSEPTRLERFKHRVKNWLGLLKPIVKHPDNGDSTVTVHNEKVWQFIDKLAHELSVPYGEAALLVLDGTSWLQDYFGLETAGLQSLDAESFEGGGFMDPEQLAAEFDVDLPDPSERSDGPEDLEALLEQ